MSTTEDLGKVREQAAQWVIRMTESPDSLSAAESAALSPSTVLDSVVFMGLSTALAGQLVSPINPRLILLGSGTILAFQRGVQHVDSLWRALS